MHHRIIVIGSSSIRIPLPNTRFHDISVYYTPPLEWLGVYCPARLRTHFGRGTHAFIPRGYFNIENWPRISIITPSYNQAKYLEATLTSILNQGYPNLELILIDGGSTDGTLEIINKYANRIYYWESEADRGQSHAINKGMRKATGQILTWINSDDRLAPNALFVVAQMFQKNPVDLVVGRCARVMDQTVEPYHFHRCQLPVGKVVPLPLNRLLKLEACWMAGHFFHQPEVFFSRDIWQRSGGYVDEELYYSMDYDLWVRFAKQSAKLISIPEVLSIFRQHPNQKTGGDDMPFLPELRRVNLGHVNSV
jgi:glycosyltransferase involved in cell wall biosynthesis